MSKSNASGDVTAMVEEAIGRLGNNKAEAGLPFRVESYELKKMGPSWIQFELDLNLGFKVTLFFAHARRILNNCRCKCRGARRRFTQGIVLPVKRSVEALKLLIVNSIMVMLCDIRARINKVQEEVQKERVWRSRRNRQPVPP